MNRQIDYEVGEYLVSPSFKYIIVANLHAGDAEQYFMRVGPGSYECFRAVTIEITTKLIEDEES